MVSYWEDEIFLKIKTTYDFSLLSFLEISTYTQKNNILILITSVSWQVTTVKTSKIAQVLLSQYDINFFNKSAQLRYAEAVCAMLKKQ